MMKLKLIEFKDRMNVINTKGFNDDDKIKISNNYLLPDLLNTYKYKDNIIFSDDIIKEIINKYDKEEGVRNLKRCFESIISKINMYELLYNSTTNKTEIDLPYDFKDFKLPYKVTKEDIDNILKLNNDLYKPPEHMYM